MQIGWPKKDQYLINVVFERPPYPVLTFQICRDECEVLEYQLCQKELAIARSQPMISHQLVLPDCKELPVIGSADNYNCVKLGMQHNSLLKPHACYR